MSALHWICALTLALVCSLSALPVKRSASGQRQLTKAIMKLQTDIKAKCPNDTRLYSPTNIHKDCLFSALNCTIMELEVVKAECNDTQISRTIKIIKTGLTRQWNIPGTPSSSRDCTCESYGTASVEKFVNNTQSLVQQLNMVIG